MLWVDKHRPLTLEKLDYHASLSTRLGKVAAAGELPHMLFYGPSGAGKKTRIMALLRAIFGSGVEKMKLERRSFKTPSKRTVEVTTVASNYHIEINPGDAGIYDRHVVQEVIKEIAQFSPLENQKSFKVVLLTEVDRLTKDAQAALRRTMEKYTSTCRLILCCQSPSKVIDPVRSRCLGIRVGAPTHDEIVSVLQTVGKKEGITVPNDMAMKIARHSSRNMRRAILMLEACKVQNYPFTRDQKVRTTDWERYISSLALDIMKEQSPDSLLRARGKLYDLLTNCIPADVIIKTLTKELSVKLDDEMKHELAFWAAYYEHRLQLGSKEIFHLEAFVAKFMSLYKAWLVRSYGA